MKEIGGYFGLEQLIKNEYYKDLIALNTGRNALLYLLKAKKARKLYIPFYLCNSVSDMLKKYEYAFEYYHIDVDFNPIFDKELKEGECLYVVNYYGQLTNEKVRNLKNKYKSIILDNTQAFFQKPIDGIDTIYSCRKFFGVPDGAYLSTESLLEEELDTDVSKNRMAHVLGRFEGKASDYYNSFKENDKSFKMKPLKYMSKLTRNILGAIDYERVKKIRDENYAYLESKFKRRNRLKLITPEGAFAYPLYTEDGLMVRRKLIENKIYVPTLWPNVLESNPKDSVEYQYASNILPLPCDQRYAIKDMERVVDLISGGTGNV